MRPQSAVGFSAFKWYMHIYTKQLCYILCPVTWWHKPGLRAFIPFLQADSLWCKETKYKLRKTQIALQNSLRETCNTMKWVWRHVIKERVKKISPIEIFETLPFVEVLAEFWGKGVATSHLLNFVLCNNYYIHLEVHCLKNKDVPTFLVMSAATQKKKEIAITNGVL